MVVLAAQSAHAGWAAGHFMSNDKPVEEHHCVPAGVGPHPAVVLLHGAEARQGDGDDAFERLCATLAEQGYYAEAIEYYSQTGAVNINQPGMMKKDFPIWMGEIVDGLNTMAKNPEIEPRRIAMMGFSLGAYLSLGIGATFPDRVSAIVEYYGGLAPVFKPQAGVMPPTLILHGDQDSIVPVRNATELDELLTKANRPHEMHIYPGADHAFNFAGIPWYDAEAGADAWSRSLKFLAAHLSSGAKSAASGASN
jgi:carboxymethylenebutenolidase